MASHFQVHQRRYTARKAAPCGDCRKALTRWRRVLTEPAMPATRLRDSELSCNPERAPSYSEDPLQKETPGKTRGFLLRNNKCGLLHISSRSIVITNMQK